MSMSEDGLFWKRRFEVAEAENTILRDVADAAERLSKRVPGSTMGELDAAGRTRRRPGTAPRTPGWAGMNSDLAAKLAECEEYALKAPWFCRVEMPELCRIVREQAAEIERLKAHQNGWDEGYAAGVRGQTYSDNPHPPGSPAYCGWSFGVGAVCHHAECRKLEAEIERLKQWTTGELNQETELD